MKFDLRSDAWIPVRRKDGTITEVGILLLLRNAPDLLEITDAYPHQEFGMYRLIMTLLMDIYRPRKMSDLENILENGAFDMDLVNSYFSEREEEGCTFDLFDKHRPFLQVPYSAWDSNKQPATVAVLNPALPSGNNHIHFNHNKESEVSLTFSDSAKALCSVSVFCTAGAQEYPSTVNGAPPIYSIVKGENLFLTLVYGMTVSDQYDNYAEEPVLWRWKRDITEKEKVATTSLLSGLTFPCRRISLIPENDRTVRNVYFGQGMNYKGDASFVDPYVCYIQTGTGRKTLKPSLDVEPWRNIATIMDCNAKTAPIVVQQYKDLTEHDVIRVNTYNVITNKAAYLDEFSGEYDFPLSIMRSDIKMNCLHNAIEYCERYKYNLENALKKLKTDMGYVKNENNLNGQISNIIKQYYVQCREALFQKFIVSLSKGKNFSEDILHDWEKYIFKLSNQQYDNFIDYLGADGRLLINAEADRILLRRVR